MEKRELNREEKEICQKQIIRLKEEAYNLKYLEKYTALLLNEGLAYSYEKQKKEYTDQLKAITQDLKNTQEKIVTIEDQIKNGVDIKVYKKEKTAKKQLQ